MYLSVQKAYKFKFQFHLDLLLYWINGTKLHFGQLLISVQLITNFIDIPHYLRISISVYRYKKYPHCAASYDFFLQTTYRDWHNSAVSLVAEVLFHYVCILDDYTDVYYY